MKKSRKILSSILTALVFTNVITPNIVGASTLNQDTIQENNSQLATENSLDVKTNFNFIKTSDISDIQYTYEENGKSYYVYESTNADLTEINTEIYEVGMGSKLLVDQFSTHIEKREDILTVTKYRDGSIVDSTNIDIKDGSLRFNSIKPASDEIYNGYVNYDGSHNKYYTSWYYAYGSNGSNYVLKLTYSVIISMLSAVTGNPYVVAGVTSAAQYILDHAIPEVYWHKDVYHVNEITYPDRRYYGSFIGERTYAKFYSDSRRSDLIGSDFYEWHDPNEWPSITIQ